MNKKRFIYGVLSLAAVCSCILLGCPEGDNEKWGQLSSLDEIKGTWKGSSYIIVPEIKFSDIEIDVPAEMKLILKNTSKLPKSRLDYSVTTTINDQDANFDIIINCKKYLDDAIQKDFVDVVWGMIKTSYESYIDTYMPPDAIPDAVDDVNIEVLDNYKVKMTGSSPLPDEEDFDLSDIEDSGFTLEINEKGDKLKLSADNAAFGMDGLEIKDIILQKQ